MGVPIGDALRWHASAGMEILSWSQDLYLQKHKNQVHACIRTSNKQEGLILPLNFQQEKTQDDDGLELHLV